MTPDPAQLLQDCPLDAFNAALASRETKEFMRQSWPILEPETPFLDNWHLDCIGDYLDAVEVGHILRLLINVPPRTLKSREVNVCWPCKVWTKSPWKKFITTSFSDVLATDHSLDRRRIIESEWYQDRWGTNGTAMTDDRLPIELADDQNTKSFYRNGAGGYMMATSMGGGVTGFGADYLIVDDPHDPYKVESEAERKAVIKQFRLKFSRRLNDKKKSAIVIVMQRLHAEDLAGVCLEMGYTHLCLEGIAKKRRFIMLPSSLPAGTPIKCDCAVCTTQAKREASKAGQTIPPEESAEPTAGKFYERTPGEYLHEDREGPREHANAKLELGSAGYAGQYDQNPTPEEGGKFKQQWFRYFKNCGDYFEFTRPSGSIQRAQKSQCSYFTTCDTAMSEKKTADFTVFAIWAVTTQGDLLLLDIIRDQIEDPDVERILRGLLESGRTPYVAVEKKANGTALIQRLVRQGLPVRAVEAEGDKVSRASTATVDMENGKIYFLANAPWLVEYELELLQFPNGAHDDQVDATSYAAIQKSREILISMPGGEVGSYGA